MKSKKKKSSQQQAHNMVPNTAINKLRWVNSQWAKWEREAVRRTVAQRQLIWKSWDPQQKKKKRMHHSAFTASTSLCRDVSDQSHSTLLLLLHFVIMLCRLLKKKTQNWSLARWMCKISDSKPPESSCIAKWLFPLATWWKWVSVRKHRGHYLKCPTAALIAWAEP